MRRACPRARNCACTDWSLPSAHRGFGQARTWGKLFQLSFRKWLILSALVIVFDSDVLHVIEISDLVDLWVIKIKKSMILCALSTSRSSNRARNAHEAARTYESFVYSTVKITRLYDYKTWPTHLFEKFTGEVRKGMWAFFFFLILFFRF